MFVTGTAAFGAGVHEPPLSVDFHTSTCDLLLAKQRVET
jgi:hypothetical protein